jgi:methylenetetrahydrofolate dehydrogenase (NADP+) / methenyltetrahydrofolate cyclohydrolase
MRIDGRKIAQDLGTEVAGRVAALRAAGVTPAMAVVVATDDGSAAWYLRMLTRTAAGLGIEIHTIELPRDAEGASIRRALARAGADRAVHGVLCQTPLPGDLRLEDVAEAIATEADIDGANPLSLGRLASGSAPAFASATAAAVVEILDRAEVPLAGRRVVVIGRSNVVGKPAALLLLNRNATVTVCHSRTVDLEAVAREADVLVVAVGRPRMVGAGLVKPGAVVVDVGTNPTAGGGLVGDVDTAAVERVAAAVTPVPGGVGPVTTMVLMRQLVTAAERRQGPPGAG